MTKSALVLASNSPRRRELLSCFQFDFRVSPVPINEDPLPGEEPGDYVLRLAESKGRSAAGSAQPGELVISADTTVADGSQILGKPADEAEAYAMLTQLRDRFHQVYTALAVLDPYSGQIETSLALSDVHMRPYSEEEIAAYIASGDPFDKAGGYAIQNEAFHPVDELRGCYSNVMGLPLCHLAQLLQKHGLTPQIEPGRNCMTDLLYDCPDCRELLFAKDGSKR
jgi:septum formation protein